MGLLLLLLLLLRERETVVTQLNQVGLQFMLNKINRV